MIHNKKNSGFSLVEILVYIAIFAALSVVIINSFSVIVASFNSTRTSRDLLEGGNTSFERITREIRLANSVDSANSVLGSTPGTLQMNSTNSGGSARIVKIILESGAVNLYEDGTLTGNLLGSNVQATSLIFRKITTTAGTAVKVEMTLQDQRGKDHRSEKFYDTVILRGDY